MILFLPTGRCSFTREGWWVFSLSAEALSRSFFLESLVGLHPIMLPSTTVCILGLASFRTRAVEARRYLSLEFSHLFPSPFRLPWRKIFHLCCCHGLARRAPRACQSSFFSPFSLGQFCFPSLGLSGHTNFSHNWA